MRVSRSGTSASQSLTKRTNKRQTKRQTQTSSAGPNTSSQVDVSFRTKDGQKVSFSARPRRRKYDVPDNPKKGDQFTLVNKKRGRKITMEATGWTGQETGKPKWRIVSNEPI